MMSLRSFIGLGIVLVALSACSDIRDDLGLGRDAPDEFAVVDRPPLSLPPDFNLRPPQPGAPRPQDVNTTLHASDILFGPNTNPVSKTEAGEAASGASDSEKAVLASSGAAHADPDIRLIVDREASEKIVSSHAFVDELLWWKETPSNSTTVDAAAEAARIKEAKDKGEPINTGATPIIERQKSGWLGL